MLLKQVKKNKVKFIVGFKYYEFIEFLNKFYNSLIFRGKKSYSIKFLNYIFFKLKKKFKKDPIKIMRNIINNLIPLFNITQKKIGKHFQYIPSIALGKRRYFLLLDWLIRKQKRKTNIFGVNVKDLTNKLIDANLKRGELVRLKKDFYKFALSNKYLLLKKKKRSKFNLKSLRRYMYNKKKQNNIYYKKKKPINLFNDIFFNSIK